MLYSDNGSFTDWEPTGGSWAIPRWKLWYLKVLGAIGLAKEFYTLDAGPKDCGVKVLGVMHKGRFYVTHIEIVDHQE